MPRRSAPSSPPPSLPRLTILNRQRKVPLDLHRIRRIGRLALPECLAERGPLEPDLPKLPEVVATIVSPKVMARVHVDFLGIEGPTDVITFPYGEILVCAEVAAENAALYEQSVDDEVALYVIHGLLHLNGFDDLTAAAVRQMRHRQAKILNLARGAL